MNTNTPADDRHHSTAGAPPDRSPRFDPQLYDPLPYGTGHSTAEPFSHDVLGFGVSPEPAPAGGIEVAERRRFGSPVLALAGVTSLGVAVWAILGAPAIAPTALLAAGLVLAVLVGLMMVIRR
ncbi:hypothetical protein [Dietzia massiliensis]|uniref:hypothetical protein n=1 Tax=Dietzia massiliensis TaxID=2697499 RepID=UPI001BCCED40|nr:hypothetical protein [Dietzia massiliensis]MBS7547405.1 hypothetical protein [Dietzia massiliensis]